MKAKARGAVKFLDEDAGIVEGIGMPYGGPLNGKDLQEEYFTPATDFCLKWFDKRPVLYQHGFDGDLKTEVIGVQFETTTKDAGQWVKVQLDKSCRYWEQIKALINAGKLYFSSGAVPHLVERGVGGEIKRWPWVELSFTPTPANPLAVVDSFKAMAWLKSVGIADEAVKALTPSDEDIMALMSQLGVDADLLGEFKAGYADELEHADVTGGDPTLTGKIVAAHLREDSQYYTKLRAAMGAEGEDMANKAKDTTKMVKPEGSPEFTKNPTHADPAAAAINGTPSMPPPTPVKGVAKSEVVEGTPAAPEESPAEEGETSTEPTPTDGSENDGKKLPAKPGEEQSVKDAQVQLPSEVVAALRALHDSILAIDPLCCQEASAPAEEEGFDGGGAPPNAQAPAAPQAPPQATPPPAATQPMGAENRQVTPEAPPQTPVAPPTPPKPQAVTEEDEAKKSATKSILDGLTESIKQAVKEAVTPLEDRLRELEQSPASEGPMRRSVKAEVNPRINIQVDETEASLAARLAEKSTDPAIKKLVGERSAALEISDIMRRGPAHIGRA